MATRDWIELILATLGGIGVFTLGLGYALGQFKRGQLDRRKDDVEGRKDAFALLQEQVESLEALCDKQQEEIVVLRTQSEEREKKAKEYLEIFQNRNPETVAFMKYLTDTANASNAYMKDTSILFTQLKSTMEKIEQHLTTHH